MNFLATLAVSLAVLTTSTSYAQEVPSVLYHFGEYRHLIKNIEAHEVPPTIWDQFIVGEQTRYGQKWYRRGLYGSSHPSYASYFSDISIGYEKSVAPWMMEVHLTQECAKEKAYDIATLFDDPRVEKGILNLRDSFFVDAQKFKSECYIYIPEYKIFAPSFESITGTRPTTACETFLNHLFAHLKPRVVIDGDWAKSWYIRDRSCIADIRGTPDHMMTYVFTDPSFWSKNTEDGNTRQSSPNENASLVPILMQALSATSVKDPAIISKVRKALSQSDIRNPTGWGETKVPNWLATRGTSLLDRYMSCTHAAELHSFQTNLVHELNQLVHKSFTDFENEIDLIIKRLPCGQAQAK